MLTRMEGYRARRDGHEFEVESLDALSRMAAEGRLRRTDEVLTGAGWVRVEELPELVAKLGPDPFDAWSDLDSEDADAIYRGYVKEGPPGLGDAVHRVPARPVAVPPAVLPTSGARDPWAEDGAFDPVTGSRLAPADGPTHPDGLVPDSSGPAGAEAGGGGMPDPYGAAGQVLPPGPPVVVPPPEPPPVAPPAPVRAGPSLVKPGDIISPDVPVTADPSLRPSPSRPDAGGEVIRFPRTPARRPPPDVPTLRERAPAPVPLVRMSRLLMWVGVGTTVLALALWFVRATGELDTGIDPARPPEPVPEEPGEAPSPAPEPEGSDLAQLDQELRAGLRSEVRAIHSDDELGDALLSDLLNLRSTVRDVKATVIKWTGRKQDLPHTAEVRVTLDGPAELDRQLLAVGLVVGRYKRTHRMEVPLLEVYVPGDAGLRKLVLDSARAEAYYEQRIGPAEFLGD